MRGVSNCDMVLLRAASGMSEICSWRIDKQGVRTDRMVPTAHHMVAPPKYKIGTLQGVAVHGVRILPLLNMEPDNIELYRR